MAPGLPSSIYGGQLRILGPATTPTAFSNEQLTYSGYVHLQNKLAKSEKQYLQIRDMDAFWVSLIERDSILPRLFPHGTLANCLITAAQDQNAKISCTLRVRFQKPPVAYPSEVLVHLGSLVSKDVRHEASAVAVIARLQQLACSKDTMGAVPRVLKVGRLGLEDDLQLDYFCEEFVIDAVPLDLVLGEISEANLRSIADDVKECTCLQEVHKLRIDDEEALSSLLGTPLNPIYDDGKSYGGLIGGPNLGYHHDIASLLKQIIEPPQVGSTHNPLVYSIIACLDLDGYTHVVIDSTLYPDLEPIHLTSKDLKNLYAGSVLCHYALHEPRNILVRKSDNGEFAFAAIVNWRHAGILPLPLESGLISRARDADCAWSRVFQKKFLESLKMTDAEEKLLRGMTLVQEAIAREQGKETNG